MVSHSMMDYYGFDRSLIADIKPTFGEQGRVNAWAANELGLKEGIPVTYRAGDQPNNALSLNVFNPGAVSYTHLDVYKRQLLDRNRKSPSPAMGTAMADRVPDINRP